MNGRGLQLSIGMVILACGSFANAGTFLNGSVTAFEFGATSSYSTTSLTLDAANNISTVSGSFSGLVPIDSSVAAFATTITGLSTSSTVENIPNFIVFSSASSFFGVAGTTPANRFDFNLTSLYYAGSGVFSGTGNIADTASAGAFADTAATFIVTLKSAPVGPALGPPPSNYNFTITALGIQPVPEPATFALLGTGLVAVWALRRRKT